MGQIKIVLSFLFLTLTTQALADVISLRTDIWCPYACDPKSERQGFMIEIAREIFERQGHKIDYDVMNWARAIDSVKMGKYNALVGCSKADAEGFEFPSVAIGITTNFYWTMRDSQWFYNDESSLLDKKIGVINDYSYGHKLDKLINKKHPSFVTVTGQNPLKRMIQMAESKRIDGFVENPFVLAHYLRNDHRPSGIFRRASTNVSDDPELFIAFGPANPKSRIYSKMLDEGMVELRKSGRLKIILDRYGISDWKK